MLYLNLKCINLLLHIICDFNDNYDYFLIVEKYNTSENCNTPPWNTNCNIILYHIIIL